MQWLAPNRSRGAVVPARDVQMICPALRTPVAEVLDFRGSTMRLLFCAFLAVSAASTSASQVPVSVSVAGTWAGPLVFKDDGMTEEQYVHVVLKPNADGLSGTAGHDVEHQYPIRKGKVATEKGVMTVAFEFIANGVHTVFDLKLVDGVLKGTARIEGEDGQVHIATAELKPGVP